MTSTPFSAMLEYMPYFGGKSGAGVFQTLINLMPPHEVYIEPFLGGGAVMRLKRPASLNVGIDLDSGPIAAYVAAAAPPDMARGSKNGEARRRTSPKLLVPPGCARADPAVSHAGARTAAPAETGEASGSTTAESWCDDKGLSWEIRQGNGIDYLEELEYESPGVLVYCDPPYLHSTRSSATRYAHELTDLEHRHLLRVLRRLKCNVMISGYSSPLYARELKGWNATAFQAATRGAPAAEWVWYNFDKPAALHDYRFLGRDFRERERIHRQQRRWIAKLNALPRLERLALLSAMRDPD